MEKRSHIAIIGGGPSGLFAAFFAQQRAHELGLLVSIDLFERNDSVGKKLRITGSGQCNITQDAPVKELLTHYGDHGRFLAKAIGRLSPIDVMKLFSQWGLSLVVREDNKVFPSSLSSRSVIETLLNMCDHPSISIQYGKRIMSVTKTADTFHCIDSQGKHVDYHAVIIATGGASYPATGSTGDGLHIASSLGHTIVPFHSALSQMKIPHNPLLSYKGLSFPLVALTIESPPYKGKRLFGPLLITHDGISGPVVLHMSRYVETGTVISISWIVKDEKTLYQQHEIEHLIARACKEGGALLSKTILHRLGLPLRFASYICAISGLDENKKAAEIGKQEIAHLSSTLRDTRYTISMKNTLIGSMVSAGGISLDEVDSHTMQSLCVKGLFFAGEVLDIDGDTGGYNLQAAWSTGALAGKHAIEYLR